MNIHKFLYGLSVSLLLTGMEHSFAQQFPSGSDAAEASAKISSTRLAAAAATGPRTSPFDPPESNDHSFVTDAAPKLDTGCIFRSSGPIVYNIEITRNVGELNSDTHQEGTSLWR